MAANDVPTITKHFSTINDPRRENRRHKLIDIITISICAVICNADSFEHIAEFGEAKFDWFKKFLELPHGIPSADTFERVFAMIDPEEFKKSFISWIQAICYLTKGEVIAIDGKKLRRSHDRSNGKSAIHMVSAWACANGIVIGQKKVDDKSNEITAIPKLLNILEIEGCLITIDAMGCQTKITKNIIDKKADYVISLKRHFKDKIEREFSYYIGSIESNTQLFVNAVRCHWGIENSLHWVMDESSR